MKKKKTSKPAVQKIKTVLAEEVTCFLKKSSAYKRELQELSLSGTELFSHFTADIIKEKVLFTR